MLLLIGGEQPSLSFGSLWPSLSAQSRGHSSVPSLVATSQCSVLWPSITPTESSLVPALILIQSWKINTAASQSWGELFSLSL